MPQTRKGERGVRRSSGSSGSVGGEKQEAKRCSVQGTEERKWIDFQPRAGNSDRCWPKHCKYCWSARVSREHPRCHLSPARTYIIIRGPAKHRYKMRNASYTHAYTHAPFTAIQHNADLVQHTPGSAADDNRQFHSGISDYALTDRQARPVTRHCFTTRLVHAHDRNYIITIVLYNHNDGARVHPANTGGT